MGIDLPHPDCHLTDVLTAGEQRILNLLAQGQSDKQIGAQLSIEPGTVRWHNQNIYDKLGLRSPFRKRRWAIHCAKQLGLLLDSNQPLPEVGDNPYKGLDAFQEEDAEVFFGREVFTQELLAKLGENDSLRFLAVVGPSGSGKSSVVRAGLLPALRRDVIPGSANWVITEMCPRLNPFHELEATLRRVAVKPQPDLLSLLQRDAYGLARAARFLLPEKRPLLLLIDQFEEVFTLVEDTTLARSFMDLIYASVTDPRSTVRVVITLRADFLDRPLMYPEFSWLVGACTAMVVPLTPDELEQAITLPASHAHVELESSLVAKMVVECHEQPGALPLLQFALTELFDNRVGRTIGLETYEEIGGTLGALTRQAEKVYRKLSETQQAVARQIFLRLVTLGEGTEDVRRRVLQNELASIRVNEEDMTYVVQFLSANRLLTLDLDPVTREPTVEVAHEALIREWGQLRVWLDESRNDVHTERLLAVATSEWHEANQDTSYLLVGSRLAQFETWAKTTDLALTADERVYLKTSAAENERRQTRQRRIRNTAFALTVLTAVVLAFLVILANNERNQAQATEQEALRQAAILLAAQSAAEAENGYFDRAVLLALAALEKYPYTAQAEHALGQAVSYNRALQLYAGHDSAVTSMDWSPDGTRIATSSTDNTVHVWDAFTGEQLLVINLPTGITGNIFDWGLTVKWTPDGAKLLTITGDRFLLGSQDYDLILWDAATGKQIKTIEIPNQAEPEEGEDTAQTLGGHYSVATAAAFAPRSGRLATVGGDNTAIIWDASIETQTLVLVGHNNDVNSVDWSPDETRLATASEDGTARIWDAQSGEALLTLSAHESAINQVAWSPDGSQLATAGKDFTARVWDAETGAIVQTIEPEAGIVSSLAWSSDGLYLVVGTDDARITKWEMQSADVVTELNGHQTFVTHLAWSPIDNRLASAGADSTARIWNAAPSTAMRSLPNSYWGAAEVEWSHDGRYLAVPSNDAFGERVPGNLLIWDVASDQIVAEDLAPLQDRWFWHRAIFSPDDQLLLAAGSLPEMVGAITAYVLDAQTGEIVRSFTVPEADEGSFVRTIDWSPDGTKVAAATISFAEGVPAQLAVWDFHTGDLITTTSCGNYIIALDWSPDGTRIAILCLLAGGSEYSYWVKVLDSETGETILTLSDPDPTALGMSVAWSPDNTYLLTTGGDDQIGPKANPVITWNANTGEKALSITRHTGQVWWGSWSPDGKRIATGSTDDTTRIWDANTGAELLTLSTPNNWSAVPQWSLEGDLLAVGLWSFDMPSNIEVWRVWPSTEDLIGYAYGCCVFRELTPEEHEQFGLPEK